MKIQKLIIKKWHFTCFLVVSTLFLTACSTNIGGMNADSTTHEDSVFDESTHSHTDTREPEWIYVPEFVTVGDDKADYGKMQLIGDTVCYISGNGETEEEADRIGRYSLTDGKLADTSIKWALEEKNLDISSCVFNSDYSVWLIVNAYPADYSYLKRYLCKFDSEGKALITREITDQLSGDVSIGSISADSQGHLYIFSGEYTDQAGIWLYNGDGSFHGSIAYNTSGSAMAEETILAKGTLEGEDGRFYVCIRKGEYSEHSSLLELDFEHCRLTEITTDFPNVSGFYQRKQPAGTDNVSSGEVGDSARTPGDVRTDVDGMIATDGITATDGMFPTYDSFTWDSTAVYGYNLSTQKNDSDPEMEQLLPWADSDVNGYFVANFGILSDGRCLCMVEDWEPEDRGLVLLTRTRREDVPPRSYLTLAAVDSGSDLTAMAVKFNRSHGQYHLSVKNYGSLTDLYNALLAGEAIDIIDLTDINVEALAGQGVFEDLGPYVDRSAIFDRSDFVDGILDVYTFDDTLAGIPETFWLRTAVGDWTQLENSAGLSLEELLTIAGRNPDVPLFDGITREELIQYIMLFCEEAFIDWDTGRCQFDTDTFRSVLELSRRLPEGNAGNGQRGGGSGQSEDDTLFTKIRTGQVLFSIGDMTDLNHFQPYQGLFGENAACVGFPTMDGRDGTLLFPRNAFGITAGSENKEAAWAFIEGILNQDTEEYVEEFSPLCSSLKKNLNARAERMMQSTLPADKYPTRIYDDGWTFQYHRLTQEEVNVILDLVKGSSPAFAAEDNPVIQIILEEASGYYSGQRKAADVIKVIQNRVQLYMDEQRK